MDSLNCFSPTCCAYVHAVDTMAHSKSNVLMYPPNRPASAGVEFCLLYVYIQSVQWCRCEVVLENNCMSFLWPLDSTDAILSIITRMWKWPNIVFLTSVTETFRQRFSKHWKTKLSGLARQVYANTSWGVQQVPNPPSREDEPFHAHRNQFLNDGFYDWPIVLNCSDPFPCPR